MLLFTIIYQVRKIQTRRSVNTMLSKIHIVSVSNISIEVKYTVQISGRVKEQHGNNVISYYLHFSSSSRESM